MPENPVAEAVRASVSRCEPKRRRGGVVASTLPTYVDFLVRRGVSAEISKFNRHNTCASIQNINK